MFSHITVPHITHLISHSVLAVLVILGTLNTILCNAMLCIKTTDVSLFVYESRACVTKNDFEQSFWSNATVKVVAHVADRYNLVSV